METILLKSVRIIDPNGPHHGAVRDVLIQSGAIAEISEQIEAPSKTQIWDQPGSAISASWIDGQADFCDPGHEPNEGLENGLQAALSGGFGHVVLNSGTQPPPDHKSAIHYILKRSADSPCHAHPLACISQGRLGDQLAELHDLSQSGAAGFSDDRPIDRTEMLRRALEYSESINLPVITCPLDHGLSSDALMHEGITSTRMGVTGNPGSSEIMRVQRDLEILRYAGGRLHFSILSTAEAVQLVRSAKKEGLQVTCGTTAHHLIFIDEDLSSFDGTLRVSPPFRSNADRKALCQGILDGTIDILVSDHRPQDLEHHDVEFALSPTGMVGIESLFAEGFTALSEASSAAKAVDAVVRSLTVGPREAFGWPAVRIEVGAAVDLTWFHDQQAWTSSHVSKGANTVGEQQLAGKRWKSGALQGQPLGVITARGSFLRTV
ncbi:MAG: amidohydrolase family protein [Bacteroidetes bacterium]|jgi:dihydroorotase|nr:amidohydrolase family protein [Bacteroidota bacterium]